MIIPSLENLYNQGSLLFNGICKKVPRLFFFFISLLWEIFTMWLFNSVFFLNIIEFIPVAVFEDNAFIF